MDTKHVADSAIARSASLILRIRLRSLINEIEAILCVPFNPFIASLTLRLSSIFLLRSILRDADSVNAESKFLSFCFSLAFFFISCFLANRNLRSISNLVRNTSLMKVNMIRVHYVHGHYRLIQVLID
ncbi:hypothetical protein DERP_011443 [Dermatophagoides pteronyssinus]|uniref:Uncharacterized protein n=1 Tax=Dermatophagoides pteronyssinus TaxID=6956 RepID=A0ABQ8J5F7_DERPT|nr:hypothetical protein DERP_011443 [Dermatophagoides pteronyssinus]